MLKLTDGAVTARDSELLSAEELTERRLVRVVDKKVVDEGSLKCVTVQVEISMTALHIAERISHLNECVSAVVNAELFSFLRNGYAEVEHEVIQMASLSPDFRMAVIVRLQRMALKRPDADWNF